MIVLATYLRTLVVLPLPGPVPVVADEAGEHQHEGHHHAARHEDGDDVGPQGGGVQAQEPPLLLSRRLLGLGRPACVVKNDSACNF